MIRINLYLHRTFELHLVFLFVRSYGALHLGFKIRAKQSGLLFIQAQDGVVGLVGVEVLVAIQEPEGVDCFGAFIARVEALFELRASFAILAQAHQVNTKLRTRLPKLRIQVERFPVKSDAFDIAPIDYEEMSGGGVGLAIHGIHFEYASDPRGFLFVVQPVHGGVDGHAIERF